jgi:CRISPR-associated endonuclease/helicase Cas3
MAVDLKFLWAKTSKSNDAMWHPLILHLLDVAACAGALLAREPETTQTRMAACLGMEWELARPWLLLIIACHDLGKACPGFQSKWPNAPRTGLSIPRIPNTEINHAFVSQIALAELLKENVWARELAEKVADAVGCHHGDRAAPTILNHLMGDRNALGSNDWTKARQNLFAAVHEVLKPGKPPEKETLSGPDFMLLSGLTSFADWIGSNEAWFPFGTPENCEDLQAWFDDRKIGAEHALDELGWEFRTPLSSQSRSFEQAFGFPPRPLQQAVANALCDVTEPVLLLVEAPMGEGKTEAAFYAHLELQRLFGHRGMYVALPTKATGNAMFKRTLKFIQAQGANRNVDLQLLHGASFLNDEFQNLRLTGISDPVTGGEIRAGEWFTNKKRGLLSEYAVGTVDQALLTILPVRHNFVRLWGLANRVVIFDEIHAYDLYTGTLLVHLLQWVLALGSSAVVLSATLPPSIRRKLACLVGAKFPAQEKEYPRLSIFHTGTIEQLHFQADSARKQNLRIEAVPSDLSTIRTAVEVALGVGGMGLILVNTVQRAQSLYKIFPEGEVLMYGGKLVGKRLADGAEVYLFHARYPADRRQKREDFVLETFGEAGARTGKKILIATQVAEQSLDLDFDVIATDLAPIDLILQRAGRLWRHNRKTRPVLEPILMIAGLQGDEPPSFGKPLWWGKVYSEKLLMLTWCLLREKKCIELPDEIDHLVQAVYEGRVTVPEFMRERLDKASECEDGKNICFRAQANRAIIGFPDDASWDDPARFVLFDEDEPGVHRTLMAQTRLGGDSIVVIPIFHDEQFSGEATPDFERAKKWFIRAVSLSRKSVVYQMRAIGVPDGWKKSPLLRNCYPMKLDAEQRWTENADVRLDNDLGIIYEQKEDQ